MKNGYIKSLDGIRALAIILVMTFHANITHFGWMGVQLFFVLSGYLITGILWKEKFSQDRISFKLKRFWARRSLRIFPLYFGYLLVLGLTWLFFHFPVYYASYAPYLFTYTFNYTRLLSEWQGNPLFTHLWSLSIEEQFYLFFPLVIFLLPARLVKYFLISIVILGPIIRLGLGWYYQGKTDPLTAADAVYWNTLSHLDAFFIGGLIPVLSLDQKIKNPQKIFYSCLAIAFFAGLANFFITNTGVPYWLDLGYNHDQPYMHIWGFTCLNLLFAATILILTSKNRNTVFRRVIENRIMVGIGKVSYGMYLFHWLIYVYIFARLFKPQNVWENILLFIPYSGTVYIVAAVSYRLYESYFIRLKDVFYRKREMNKETNASYTGIRSATKN